MTKTGKCVSRVEISPTYRKSGSLISWKVLGVLTGSSEIGIVVNKCIRNFIIE